MQKSLSYKNQKIDYTIKKSTRAKRVRIAISYTNGVVLTVPRFVSVKKAEKFLQEKAHWIQEQQQKLIQKNTNPNLTIDCREHFEKYKTQALDLITKKVEYWNRKYGFKYTSVRVKKLKTKWGSCSSKGSLNFNYKLLFMDEQFVDYVVVHELCHLKEMNHSKRFWDLVAKEIPDYKKIRKIYK